LPPTIPRGSPGERLTASPNPAKLKKSQQQAAQLAEHERIIVDNEYDRLFRS